MGFIWTAETQQRSVAVVIYTVRLATNRDELSDSARPSFGTTSSVAEDGVRLKTASSNRNWILVEMRCRRFDFNAFAVFPSRQYAVVLYG